MFINNSKIVEIFRNLYYVNQYISDDKSIINV